MQLEDNMGILQERKEGPTLLEKRVTMSSEVLKSNKIKRNHLSFRSIFGVGVGFRLGFFLEK